MSDFKERLNIEIDELNQKMIKLKEFLTSDKVENIKQVQRDLLKIQLNAMETYLSCLITRVINL